MRPRPIPLPADGGVERLLAPIAPDRPAGDWLRWEPVYDEIKHLREEDDPNLPQGVWQRELKRADWAGVAALCTETLATRSKDLQIAAWLTEAWIHRHGFPGLERGLRLLCGLCQGFWESVHPSLEDVGLEARLSPLAWVADRLPLPLKQVPVTSPASEDSVPYGWADWEAGAYLANLAKRDAAAAAKAQERGMVPQARFQVSISLTPTPFLAALSGEVAGALAAIDELAAALEGLCGEAAPSLTPLKSPLASIQTWLARLLEERGETAPGVSATPVNPEEIPTMEGEDAPAAPPPAPAPRPAGIASRAEAYQRLNEAADYLMRTEPHSPAPYLVKRAVSWGNMSLADLLQELLQKNADLPTLYALLGIKR